MITTIADQIIGYRQIAIIVAIFSVNQLILKLNLTFSNKDSF